MYRLLAGTAAVTAVAATDAGYAPQVKSGYSGGNTGYAPQAKSGYGGNNYAPRGKGGYGGGKSVYAPKGKGGDDYAPKGKGYNRKTVTFPPAYAIIDPDYYSTIFTGYQNCVAAKCDVLPSDYSATGINDRISTIAGYTSCVTACAAGQALETVEDFRTLLESVIEIGNDQLRQARVYLSGLGELDVIGERVHIGESCCLPNSHFASWERIMIPVKTKLKRSANDHGNAYHPRYPTKNLVSPPEDSTAEATPYMMSAADYISHCTSVSKSMEWLDDTVCDDTNKIQYLQALQRNIGHLILAPSCVTDAPDGACCEDAHPNPRAVSFRGDVCVATTYEVNGKIKTLTTPLIKPTATHKKRGQRYDPCPCDEIQGAEETPKRIHYDHVSARDLLYYTVTEGLPSSYSPATENGPSTCNYKVGLAMQTPDGFFTDIPVEETPAPTTSAPTTPAVTTATPAETTATPAETTATPAETTATPAETTATPAETTATPAETTATPAETTVTPAETTATPAETTATPAETTATPTETTATPAETTATPAETTATPAETTVTPAETTVTPAGVPVAAILLARYEVVPNGHEVVPINKETIEAAHHCPTDGLFEYCNVDQYASYLEYQLFDHANCDIADLRTQHTDYSSSYQTIACLYKIFSLKCDCMEAVLSCYSVSSHYASSLSKVIGQAASILCGFVLCQRPNVYALFGDEYAIDRASLMRQLLMSAGIFSAGEVSPAAAVFLSFGIGMIALVVAKTVAATKKAETVDMEEGYENLI